MGKRTTVDDGAFPSERMRELGRRGAAAVERDPVTKRFRRREAAPPPDPTPPALPAPEPATPPAPPVTEAPGLLARYFGRRRR